MKKLGVYMFAIAGIIALLGCVGGVATAQTAKTTCPNCGMEVHTGRGTPPADFDEESPASAEEE